MRKRATCARNGCSKPVPKSDRKYCSVVCSRASKKIPRPCKREGCPNTCLYPNVYCSMECSRRRVERSICAREGCSNLVKIPTRKYCSRTCGNLVIAQARMVDRVERICKMCNEPFMARVTDVARRPCNFCGNRCARRWNTTSEAPNLVSTLGVPWSEQEDDELRRSYGQVALSVLAKRLSGRTKKAIRARAQLLGFTKAREPLWTREEDERMLQLVETKSYRDVGKILGRSESAISRRIRKLGYEASELRTHITTTLAASLTGRSVSSMLMHMRQGTLKAKQIHGRRGLQWVTTPDSLREFIVTYPDEIRMRSVTLPTELITLIAGKW